MAKMKKKLQFRYYTIPTGDYILAKIGKSWEQEYGLGYGEMLHFHNYLEIGYCYSGKGRLIIENKTYRYGNGYFTIIPANIPHTTISDAGNICKWEFLFIDLEEFIKNEMKTTKIPIGDMIRIINKHGTMKTMKHHAAVGETILKIIKECREEGLYYKESLKGYLEVLVIEILRLDEEREQVHKGNKQNQYIKNAIDYFNIHYSQDIKIAEMAEKCGLSESHFRKVFEDTMNMKPNDFINFVRIRKACDLMKRADMSMDEIGIRVGYQTASTFNRNFRKITGNTPYQWKKEEQSHEGIMTDFKISAEKGW